MIWIRCLVVISLMAAETGCWDIGVVIALMTSETVNGKMSALQNIIIIVNWERCRLPVRDCCMTGFTSCRNPQCAMIRIDRIVVIGLVTTNTGGGGIVVIPARVTAVAINRCMRAGQQIIIIMNGKGRRAPAGIGRMTFIAGGRKAKRNVIGIGGIVVIGLVTSYTRGGGIVVIAARVTAVAINRCMAAG